MLLQEGTTGHGLYHLVFFHFLRRQFNIPFLLLYRLKHAVHIPRDMVLDFSSHVVQQQHLFSREVFRVDLYVIQLFLNYGKTVFNGANFTTDLGF